MGRYRPPAPRSSPYITGPGAKSLRQELQDLWRQKRPEVTKALAAAAAEGDRSENAEYIYRKKQLAEIDRRIRYLSKRLDQIKVVDRPPEETGRVYFGAWVSVEQSNGQNRRYRIVGADETSAELDWISVDSPMARALLGKRSGQSVKIVLPDGKIRLKIVAIEYESESG